MLRPVNRRVNLTEIRPGDRASFLEYLNDRELHRYTCRLPYPYTEECFGQWMQTVSDAIREYGEPIHWAIRDHQQRLIGGIGFDNLIKGHRAEIGYWLARPFWGQGIMSAVVRKACQVAMSQWKLVRLTALVFHDNSASIRVLEKNQFAREARLKKYFHRDGEFSDALLFAKVI